MWLALALVAGITLITGWSARSVPIAVENRCLLVFDTSSAMKPCLPVIKDTVGQLFITMMNGDLKAGDSIGVWTFATKVSTGEMPLQVWHPEYAATIASNIVTFVQDQRYAKTTDFKAVLPLVDRIVQSSDRLTVIIFCDGDGQFSGTPYDTAVNAIFKQDGGAMQKGKRPFVVVLRSQLGEYVGCRVTFAPASVNYPPFPPLPEAPVPLSYAPTNPAPPPPPARLPMGPPLIIIGTKVGTNPPPDNPSPAEPVLALKETDHATNPVVVPQTNLPAPVVVITNVVTVTDTVMEVSEPVRVTPTNAIVIAEKPGLGSGGALAIGAGLLAAAVVLIVWMMRRVREAGQSSLITRSLDRENDHPPKT